jgi:predicted transcriptional regulator
MPMGATSSPRHAILDLAPLELDCMTALWRAGEASVREVQEALIPTRPRAYTTIMTILDRLAQKGAVQRRKSGRAWVYAPVISEREARSRALARLIDGFFSGSPEALAAHLSSQSDAVVSGVSQHAEASFTPVRHTAQASVAEGGSEAEEPTSASLETSLL